MDINKKIDKLRFERGWSMYELAQESGITQSTLTSMMKRGNPPKIENLECICEAFGITLAQFFTDEEALEYLSNDEKLLVNLFRRLPIAKQKAIITLMER